MGEFRLHPQLEQDSVPVIMLELSEVRLQTDANYPWLVLVPQLAGARHIHRLSEHDQQLLLRETSYVAERFEKFTGADNINVAALGNMVPQLHVHIVARFEGDPAWPGPIWGIVPRKPYEAKALEAFKENLKAVLV